MDDFEDFGADDLGHEASESTQRSICHACERPERTCWCGYVPRPAIKLSRSKVVIIQHPKEAKRKIRTAKMLQAGLDSTSCQVFVRRKIASLDTSDNRDLSEEERRLRTLLRHPGAVLLFPEENAFKPDSPELRALDSVILVVLDGTWDEAKKIYAWSPPLKSMPKLTLDIDAKSQYVVKTQPNDKCLSTVESVAYALNHLEQNSSLSSSLTQPLLALCSIQISHGAVKHDSKEFKRDIATFEKENCRRSHS